VEGLDCEGVLGRWERLLDTHAETGMQQKEPPCAPPPQICKGEETQSGQACFELVISCEADGNKLITAILYLLFLALPTSPLCARVSSPGAQALPCGKTLPQDGDPPLILSVSVFGVVEGERKANGRGGSAPQVTCETSLP